jgi:L-amino acid N-acyltransferase YncA
MRYRGPQIEPAGTTFRMSRLSIRPAETADIAAITDIYADAVRFGTATFEIDPPDHDEMARRYRELRTADFPYLVAESAGTIAGYAYAGPYRTRPAYRWTVEDSIYVAAHAQRQGLGRALLRALIAEAEIRNYRQMIAVIGDSMQQPASIALHRAEGFQLIGTQDAVGFKLGRWLDTVLMQRSIGPGAMTPP